MNYLEEFRKYIIGTLSNSESTAENYLSRLKLIQKHIGKPIQTISNDEFQDYFIGIKKHKKINTIRLEQTVLRIFFHWYCLHFDKSNPVQELRIIREETITPHLITKKEFNAMIQACGTTSFQNLRNCAVLILLADTGIRLGELAQIRVQDISLDRNRFVLSIVHTTKIHQQRQIPFCELKEGSLVAEYWTAYWQVIRYVKHWDIEMPLFQRKETGDAGNGIGIGKARIYQMVRYICKQAKIEKNITPHSFRHFYATYCLAHGMKLKVLQMRLGHKRIDTTSRYLHLADIVKQDSLRFNPLMQLNTRQMKGFVKSMKNIAEK